MITDEKQLIAGIDDATKCPCIGSIFVAGVLATQEVIAYWKELGVKDSKCIVPKKRIKLAEIIKKTAISFSIQEMPPAMIDNKCFNLNDWEMLTVFNIIIELQKTNSLHKVYIDNWEVNKSCFEKRFKKLIDPHLEQQLSDAGMSIDKIKLNLDQWVPEHYADENYVVVGAASILAKTASDFQYQEYKKIYGDFGSGSPADPKTRLFVWHNRHNPPPIIRKSWQTFKTLSQLKNIEDDPFYNRLKKQMCSYGSTSSPRAVEKNNQTAHPELVEGNEHPY